MSYPVAMVTWLDATHADTTEEISSDVTIGILRQSVGYLLRNDEQGVVLAFTEDEGAYAGGFTIPAAYVRDVVIQRPQQEEDFVYTIQAVPRKQTHTVTYTGYTEPLPALKDVDG